jgi:2-keto-4-pentenoate hydratase/2-oxohepta-3-ene-1,7-dioic acid hydratase in catechol pathway
MMHWRESMKIVQFRKDRTIAHGILKEDTVYPISGSIFSEFNVDETDSCDAGTVTFLPPVYPSKVVAVGLNYRDHAEEVGAPIPDEPILFMKPSTAVIGPEEPIVHPASCSRMDYEAEIALVTKDKAYRVSEEDAKSYILGYTCLNDVTARDLQSKDGQWTRSKSFNTFCPIGPVIETELNPQQVNVSARVNGETRQSSNTRNFIFPIFRLFSFVSHIMTLLPGDIITTGTPSGIGAMKPGDTVEIEVEGVGILKNPVVSEKSAG